MYDSKNTVKWFSEHNKKGYIVWKIKKKKQFPLGICLRYIFTIVNQNSSHK